MNMKNFTPENYTTVADEIEDALSSWESDDIPVAALQQNLWLCGVFESPRAGTSRKIEKEQ